MKSIPAVIVGMILCLFAAMACAQETTLQGPSIRFVKYQSPDVVEVICSGPAAHQAFWNAWLANWPDSERSAIARCEPFRSHSRKFLPVTRVDARTFDRVAPVMFHQLEQQGFTVVQ